MTLILWYVYKGCSHGKTKERITAWLEKNSRKFCFFAVSESKAPPFHFGLKVV